jgi:hypothetical protein
MRRREFLALAAALPTLWIPKKAHARTAAFGRVKHLLVLYAKGGFRSHATFNAVGSRAHNPWGAQSSAAEWKYGAAANGADIITTRGTIDGFAKRTSRVAVLASVDHTPNALADVDHRTASLRIGTGAPDGTTGLLTLIGAHHPRYANGFTPAAVPPIEIGASEFGLGSGEMVRYRPLSVGAPEESLDAELTVRNTWNAAARDRLDRRFLARKAGVYSPRIENFTTSKQNTSTFADLLRDPRLDLFGAPTATDAGVTNAELLELFGREPLSATDDASAWGPRVALALRFFSFGAPACVVTNDIYDLHDDERSEYAPRATDLVRQLAALDEVLRRMPHPEGGTYYDATMVAVVSEFSRNNTGASGFNSGNGSDHVEEEAGPCRNQAIAVMGGVVRAAGKQIGSTDAEMNATGKVLSSRSLLSTFLDVLGLSHEAFFAEPPIEELFA